MPRIIPPILLLGSMLFMILGNSILPINKLVDKPYSYIGLLLIIVGYLMARSIQKKYQAIDTEIHTFKTPRKLVLDGLFKYSRNPIYLGMLIVLIGGAISLGSLITFIFPLLFFILINFQHIPFEETMLEQTFGEEYLEYKGKVRRWI